MNRKNVEYAKALMQSVGRLDMTAFQRTKARERCGNFLVASAATDMQEFHACGNSACFAGYVALSEKFKADGGEVMNDGGPEIDGRTGSWAIARWLGISDQLAERMVYGPMFTFENSEPLYSVPFLDVRPVHVIEVLDRILSGELK